MTLSPVPFDACARLPEEGDNAAIATERLAAGTRIEGRGLEFTLPRTVLEGHRFACRPIGAGEALLSWGLPFGRALRPIEPGEWVVNAGMLRALRDRDVDVELPDEPNFADHFERYSLPEGELEPGVQVEAVAEPDVRLGVPERVLDVPADVQLSDYDGHWRFVGVRIAVWGKVYVDTGGLLDRTGPPR